MVDEVCTRHWLWELAVLPSELDTCIANVVEEVLKFSGDLLLNILLERVAVRCDEDVVTKLL